MSKYANVLPRFTSLSKSRVLPKRKSLIIFSQRFLLLYHFLQSAEAASLFTVAGVHVHAPCGNKRGVFVCPRAGQTVLNVSPASGRMRTGVFLTHSPADCRVTGSGFGHFEPPVDRQKKPQTTQRQEKN